MKSTLIAGLAGTSLLVLSACSNDNNSTPPLTGAFRLVNGSSDSNGLSASATSGFPSTATVNFDSAGSIVDAPEGGYNVQVKPGSGNQFTVNNVSIDHNNLTTLFTYGSSVAGTANGFVAEENLGTPSSGNFTFQFANDTSQTATAALSVYLVKLGAGISGVQPAVPAVNAASASQGASIPAGTYEIIVTNGTSVLYDSGSTQAGIVLPTPNTNVIQIGALDATSAQATANGSPITLILMDNNGGETLHLNGQN